MKIILSFDDGHTDDYRLADLLNKYNLNARIIFYPTYQDTELIKTLAKDFEIGGHTMTHALLTRVNKEQAEWEITECRKQLQQLTGQEINSFCYPRGYYDDEVKELVKQAGFKEARTVKVLETNEGNDPYELPTTIHAYPNRKEYERYIVKKKNWLAIAKMYFKKDGYFHLWGHSWELTKFGLWEDFEELIKYIKENENLHCGVSTR